MKTNTLFLLRISIIASLGGLLFGYDTGVINGTQVYFSEYFGLEGALQGWVVSCALIGCLVGAMIAGPISKKYGRKNSLIISAILFTISAWGSGLPGFVPETIPMLVIFRLIGGLGVGMASMNAPMYIAELAPAGKRGMLVTWYQMAIVLGFFIVFLVTYFIGSSNTHEYNLEQGWREMFWSELVPCFLFLGLLFFVPKSPRWLVMVGREEEAKKTLIRIHGEEIAKQEMVEIHQSLNSTTGSIGWKKAFAAPFLVIILIGTVLSMLQQFTGINAVLYYGAQIFKEALGFDPEDALSRQVLVAGVNVVCTIIAMYQVDKWGRKPLIIWGSVGMFIGFALLGGSMLINQVGIVSLIGVLMFVGSFALSMGPVVWVVLSEMFPNSVRAIAMSVAVAAQWGANFLISQTFPIIEQSDMNQGEPWNKSMPYFIFMVFILIIIFFTKKFVPETKGKSLEQIEAHWLNK